MSKKISIKQITLIGVMSALVFASSKISIPIGNISRLHLGNVLCLLSGFLLGPLSGGLSAGIGSVLYDLTDPVYIASAPFTFVFKFLMAFICGKIAYLNNKKGLNIKSNITAAICGNLIYVLLNSLKNFLEITLLLESETFPALIVVGQKALIYFVNMVIACIISVPLAGILNTALSKANIRLD